MRRRSRRMRRAPRRLLCQKESASLGATFPAVAERVIETFPSAPAIRTLSICLVNPKFEPSYWGFDYALPLYPGEKRCTMIPGALPALAGLAPRKPEVLPLDENAEPIDFDALRRFDIVGVT